MERGEVSWVSGGELGPLGQETYPLEIPFSGQVINKVKSRFSSTISFQYQVVCRFARGNRVHQVCYRGGSYRGKEPDTDPDKDQGTKGGTQHVEVRG